MKKHKIKVGTYDYDVVFSKEIKYEEDDCAGLTDKGRHNIYINSEMEYLPTLETLCHELFHAIEDSYKLKLSEKTVSILGVAWAGIINDNKVFNYAALKLGRNKQNKTSNSRRSNSHRRNSTKN